LQFYNKLCFCLEEFSTPKDMCILSTRYNETQVCKEANTRVSESPLPLGT